MSSSPARARPLRPGRDERASPPIHRERTGNSRRMSSHQPQSSRWPVEQVSSGHPQPPGGGDASSRVSQGLAGMHLDLDSLNVPRKPSGEGVSPFSAESRLGPGTATAGPRMDASGRTLRLDTTPDGLSDSRAGDYMSRPPQQREVRSPGSSTSAVSPLDSASTINSPSARFIGQAGELHTKILALQRTRSKHATGERRRFSSSSSTSSQPRATFAPGQGGVPFLPTSQPCSQPSSGRTSVSTPDIDASTTENVLDTDDESVSSLDEAFDKLERGPGGLGSSSSLGGGSGSDRSGSDRSASERLGDRSAERLVLSPFSSVPNLPSSESSSFPTPTNGSFPYAAMPQAATSQSSFGSRSSAASSAEHLPSTPKFDPSSVISPTATSMMNNGSGVALGRASSFRSQQRTSLSERRGRGMRLDMSGGAPAGNPGGRGGPLNNGLRTARSGAGAAAGVPTVQSSRGFSKFSNIVDKEHGCLRFEDKARVHAHGIEFSSGEKFNISMDKIEYVSELGAGNYGTVNKVLHRPNNVLMAVKEIRLELEDASLRQIIMELDVLHRCGMDNIIAFYGAFFAEGSVYICMEYMDGGSINQIYEGGIPEKFLRYIVRAVVKGLRHLKEQFNIIHRDVKPTNILCSTDGQVKLCDFGVSGNLVMSIARTNIGCQPYMAPERIKVDHLTAPTKPNEYTVESDIWSLGLSVIEMAQGKYPYPPETYANIFSQLSAIVEDEPPALDTTKYSSSACDFVAQLLSKSPTQRPRYGEILQHPWLQKEDCTPEEMGAFIKERLARAEPGAHREPEQPTLTGTPVECKQ